jgi:hypothetical protein
MIYFEECSINIPLPLNILICFPIQSDLILYYLQTGDLKEKKLFIYTASIHFIIFNIKIKQFHIFHSAISYTKVLLIHKRDKILTK